MMRFGSIWKSSNRRRPRPVRRMTTQSRQTKSPQPAAHGVRNIEQTLFGDIGPDLTKFRSASAFASRLGRHAQGQFAADQLRYQKRRETG